MPSDLLIVWLDCSIKEILVREGNKKDTIQRIETISVKAIQQVVPICYIVLTTIILRTIVKIEQPRA
jgi:hypothetical protein